ncbi:glycosyltransferase [Domibacillus sp. DTU_2020_1001157_1_SI_ALB_TIR_016]|uniref:glycosyltransferase n=1 Tax=Domibacillus sp. DTU_2020_1001157_1_SI_ALB_TIR_016 TaxID=3077789 RepID=UPI0028E1F2D2|nr:glycosyltransferase [Domibacillus sp. DTU_2020_1001157_1_SI_ALB_TIR_016]WNS81208.1 glycosyltransferase [Domibacillus sp. DTU_2020_1001157_1_SI_ALB_TIR_016]
METKKVALFLPSLVGGGAERVMLSLASEFADQGHHVDLVLAKATGDYMHQVPANVHIVDLDTPRVLYSLFPLIRYLKEHKPQSVLSALDHTNVVAICAVSLANINAKTVVSIHNNLTQFAKVRKKSMIMRLIPSLMKWSFKRAHKVIAVSQGVADDVIEQLQLPEEKVQVIYNPVVDDALIQKANEPLFHPWFQKGEPPVLLAVGRLTPEKDFPNLLRAFAKLRQQKEARLIILGEGGKRAELEELIAELGVAEDVQMPGFVDNPYAYMKNARLFVLSSYCEGLPTVLIEALACGTEVVSTDCPSGPKEILKGGRYGSLVEIDNSDALFQAILEQLDTPKAEANREAYEPFWKTNVSRQYLEIL